MGKIKPNQNKYYTSEEAIKWMMKTKHWGPWQMSGDTVMAEEIPDDKKEIGRKRIPIPKKILMKL